MSLLPFGGLLLVLVAATLLPVGPVRESRALVLVLGLLLVFACRWRSPWRTAIFATACLAFGYQGFPPEGWLTMLALYVAGEAIEVLRTLEARPRAWLLRALGVLGAVVAVDAVGAMSVGAPPVGLLGDTSTTGAYLGMVAAAVWLLWPPLLALVPVALWGAGSTTGVAALLAAGLVAVAMTRPRYAAAAVPAGLALLAVFVLAADAHAGPWLERLGVWQATLGRLDGWAYLVGHGPGSFAALGLHDGPGRAVWVQAHNELVQWAYEAGALGVVAVTGYGVSLSHGLRRASAPHVLPVAAMLVAFAVASCGHFVARLASTAVVGIVACGLAESLGMEAS